MITSPPQSRAGTSTEEFSTGVILELYQTIIDQEQGAIKGDVDAIHDMRVAVRRLRVALSNFACTQSREDGRRFQSHLKNLADPLGEVRDFDVLIEALAPRSNEGAIKSVIGRMRERRRRRLHKLVEYFQSDEYAIFKREFSSFESRSEAELKKHGQAA
jgi:CHAD domain-containing protein